ncbi:MAG: MFS transporter [Pirellulales bacterium]
MNDSNARDDATMESVPQTGRPAVPANRLTSRSFLGLLVTQLLGAVNDNTFRWLVIGIGKDYVPQNIGMVLMAGTACFVLPYLLLAAPAGYLADRFDKRQVIVGCKLAEVVIMVLGVAAILVGNIWLLLGVVAAMGAQSALFGPAKLGSIPEMLAVEKISSGNGVVALTTVIATVVGMGAGSWLADATGAFGQERWWLSGLVLIGTAGVGLAASLLIAPLPVANPARRFPWNTATQTARDLKTLAASRPMLRVALGIMFFWALGALAQLNIDQFVSEGGARAESDKVPLLFSLVIGVGLGSVLAGVWSGGRVELGIVPLGALGVLVGSALLFTVEGALIDAGEHWTAAYLFACGFLLVLGVGAGLFNVPLAAYMQHRSPQESRGAILAASNFMTFGGILCAAVLFSLLRLPIRQGAPLFSARQIFLLCAAITLPVLVYIVWLIPQASARFLVWTLGRTIYRIRVLGHENLPERGGAVLVANHISWLDGFLMMMVSSRPVRMFAAAVTIPRPLRWIARSWGVILVDLGPKGIARGLETARRAVAAGELVCIFPEGAISRTGQMRAFRGGVLKIIDGRDVPVVPVYLDELWGSIFSFERGRFFWKWPRRWPYPISIHIGKALPAPHRLADIQAAVTQLGSQAVSKRNDRPTALPRLFIRRCKRHGSRSKIADSSGADLTGRETLLRALVLRRVLRRDVLDAERSQVGVLLPPRWPASSSTRRWRWIAAWPSTSTTRYRPT